MDSIGGTIMKYTYEVLTDDFGTTILRSDGACIPANPDNADYQAYLNKDKAEQSTPSVTNGDQL